MTLKQLCAYGPGLKQLCAYGPGDLYLQWLERERPVRIIQRAWRRWRERRRRVAAVRIADAWLAAHYAPGGRGAAKAVARLVGASLVFNESEHQPL